MNRKTWLIIKSILLLTVIVLILIEPVKKKSWVSIAITVFFVISLIIDVVEYRKIND